VVTHGDVIRLALAHFAGVHLDLYQRFEAGPGSISAVSFHEGGTTVLRVNDTGTLEDLAPPRRRPRSG
jgi:probable phosphoglycerate mutase